MSKSEPQTTLCTGTSEQQQDNVDDSIDDSQASIIGSIDRPSPTSESDKPIFNDGEDSRSDGGEMADSDNPGSEENLEPFGVDEDHRPNNPRLDNPDGDLEEDRRTNIRREADNTTQEQLFPDIDDENQLTLGGDKAYNQCKFE